MGEREGLNENLICNSKSQRNYLILQIFYGNIEIY